MSSGILGSTGGTLARQKSRVAGIRTRAQTLFESGAQGIQIATAICESTDHLLLEFIEEQLGDGNESERKELSTGGAIIAVGGTGRGELAPYSDVDLLFLCGNGSSTHFREFVATYVQNCWDAGFKLGHSVRQLGECITLARQDPQIATSLIDARCLWGDEGLYRRLMSRFKKQVVDRRRRQFIEDCLIARGAAWSEHGPAAQELEPDVKTSLGGLRDLHLLRWVGFAQYGVSDIDKLRLEGAITKADAIRLRESWEFLTRIRIDLHLAAGKPQDRLTRDEQLRIAESRNIEETPEQRPVERFMQEYFRYSSQLAAITRRFATLQRRRPLVRVARDLLIGHRSEGFMYVGPEEVDVTRRNLPKLCAGLEPMLRLYKAAALYAVMPSPRAVDAIRSTIPKLPRTVSRRSAELFRDILRCTKTLGPILRSMFDTGLLDILIPDFTHVRNLMQFNQYHSFTVDEHTLRAVEAATAFEDDDSPIGAAYSAIRQKEILHLALLLHDVGKGFDRDHCIVGEEIAQRIAQRLFLPAHQAEQLALLVLKHLEMADLALRRDITDPKLLLDFSRDVGAPDTLRMLYVLTACDVSAVGPGVWTSWKANLLTELFDRCMVILSGKHYSFHEQERMRRVRNHVSDLLADDDGDRAAPERTNWVERQLDGVSAYYLTCTPPEQIAADLRVIRSLTDDEIAVQDAWDEMTQTTEYRIVTRNPVAVRGCFHKIAGVLTAKSLEILSADVNTTAEGIVVDSYRVLDADYEGQPPADRVREIADAIRSNLLGAPEIEILFQRHQKFGGEEDGELVSGLPTRVKVDADSSDSRTIIDVFAQDRRGLLYVIARTLYELDLSVDLAKIATHFDQVVDVFYVRENDSRKVTDEVRLKKIRSTLETALEEFVADGHRAFSR